VTDNFLVVIALAGEIDRAYIAFFSQCLNIPAIFYFYRFKPRFSKERAEAIWGVGIKVWGIKSPQA